MKKSPILWLKDVIDLHHTFGRTEHKLNTFWGWPKYVFREIRFWYATSLNLSKYLHLNGSYAIRVVRLLYQKTCHAINSSLYMLQTSKSGAILHQKIDHVFMMFNREHTRIFVWFYWFTFCHLWQIWWTYGTYAVSKCENICSLYLYMVSIIFLFNVL